MRHVTTQDEDTSISVVLGKESSDIICFAIKCCQDFELSCQGHKDLAERWQFQYVMTLIVYVYIKDFFVLRNVWYCLLV